MRDNRIKLGFSAACLLLCAVTLLGDGSFAWLSKEQAVKDAYVALSDFEVEGALTFDGKVAQTGSSVLIPVSLKAGTANYIGDMKYVVRYTGASPALIRVRVLEQWVDTTANEIAPMSFLDYALSTQTRTVPVAGMDTLPAAGPGAGALAVEGRWVDERDKDYCYYYSVPVQPKALTTPKDTNTVTVGEGTVELTLIDQTQPDADTAGMIGGLDSGVQLMLLIEVEAVQPNRYREFWHMDALPVGVG